MVRSAPPSDWVVYAVVLGTVAAMLLGKYLMFFDDKGSEAEQVDDTVEEIFEEAIEETIEEVIHEVEETIHHDKS